MFPLPNTPNAPLTPFESLAPPPHRNLATLCYPYSLDPLRWHQLFQAAVALPTRDRWLARFCTTTTSSLAKLSLDPAESHLLFAQALSYLEDQPHLATYGCEAILRALEAAAQDLRCTL